MKNVVFKLNFNHPNKLKTPKLNANHFSYICKRLGAMYNDGKNFCCFGKVSSLGYITVEDIDDFTSTKEYIAKKSKEKTTIYKGVISLTEEDAINKGFDKRSEWKSLIKNKANKIAKEMDIKIENFEYVCSVHMEKGHPHLHFMAWDKNQEVQRTIIPKNRINNIRKDLTNYIFHDELEVFYNSKNKSKEDFKENFKNMFSELDDIFCMSDKDYKKYVEDVKSLDLDLNKGRIFNNKLKETYLDEIMNAIYELKKELPKKGRLNYGFMPEEIKKNLDGITKKILSNNIELKSNFAKYLSSIKDIAEFSSKNAKYIDKNIKNAENELHSFSGNQILNICKKIGKKEASIKINDFENKKQEIEEMQKNFERQQVINLISNLTNFMSRSENKNISQRKVLDKKENSLAYKQELAKKLENKSSIDWGWER